MKDNNINNNKEEYTIINDGTKPHTDKKKKTSISDKNHKNKEKTNKNEHHFTDGNSFKTDYTGTDTQAGDYNIVMGNKSNNKEHTSTNDSTKLIDIQKIKTKIPDNRHLNIGKTNKNEPQNMDVNTFKTESTGPDTKVDNKPEKTINSQLVLTSTDLPYKNFNWDASILKSPLWAHQLEQLCKQSSISFDLSKKLVFGSEGLT